MRLVAACSSWPCWAGGAALPLHLGDSTPVFHPWEISWPPSRRDLRPQRTEQPHGGQPDLHQPFIDPLDLKPKHDKLAVAVLLKQRLNVDWTACSWRSRPTNSRHHCCQPLVDRPCLQGDRNEPEHSAASAGENGSSAPIRRWRRLSGVIGFVKEDGEGGAGIEQQCNSYLKASPAASRARKGTGCSTIPGVRTEYVPVVDGASIHLTIDNNIQYQSRNRLSAVAQQFKPAKSWSLVEKVDTVKSWPGVLAGLRSQPLQRHPAAWTGANLPLCVSYEPG